MRVVGQHAQVDRDRTVGARPAERLVIAPACGMKYLPRESAEGKMRAMAGAAALLRAELP